MKPRNNQNKDHKQYVSNLTLAAVAGLVGFLTMVIILAAVFGGLWLDNRYDTKPLYTLILVIGSMPLTLVLMFVIVRKVTRKIEKSTTTNVGKEIQQEEEDHFE